MDLETLDTEQTSVVLSIGLVMWDDDFDDGAPQEGTVIYPSFDQQLRDSRTISMSTLAFWMENGGGDAAKQTFVPEKHRVSAHEARLTLHEWFKRCLGRNPQTLDERGLKANVWANGDLFDLGLLQNLWTPRSETAVMAMRSDRIFPWTYNSPRDMRTVCDLALSMGWSYLTRDEERHPAHSALADCESQIEALRSARAFIRGTRS